MPSKGPLNRLERIFIEIDLSKIEGNYREIGRKVGEDVKVLSVVKADAYGHGMLRVSEKLKSCGCDFFGVSWLSEALELRRGGIKGTILIMGGLLPDEAVEAVIDEDLSVVVHDHEGLKRVLSFAKNSRLSPRIHLKFDTGMGRLGFRHDETYVVIEALRKGGNLLKIEGIMSHFSSSEVRDSFGLKQIERFKEIVNLFEAEGIKPKYIHMANTGALVNYPEAYFNMVRVGIGLYGSYPSRSLEGTLNIQEAFSLKSRISHIREFDEGTPLSYGRSFVTRRKTRIGFLPCGYSDGIRRGLSNLGSVLINGARCKIVGRVCMDWVLIDVTDVDCNAGDEVILIGGSGSERIGSLEVAEKLDTIPYEIFCTISRSVKRYYR